MSIATILWMIPGAGIEGLDQSSNQQNAEILDPFER